MPQTNIIKIKIEKPNQDKKINNGAPELDHGVHKEVNIKDFIFTGGNNKSIKVAALRDYIRPMKYTYKIMFKEKIMSSMEDFKIILTDDINYLYSIRNKIKHELNYIREYTRLFFDFDDLPADCSVSSIIDIVKYLMKSEAEVK